MQVNFKGLYKIPGSWENARGYGETMHDISSRKLQAFVDDTQNYMEPNGCSYISKENNDLYFTVQPKFERNFEEVVDDYHIDCYKVADNISTNENLCEKLNMNLRQKIVEDYSKSRGINNSYKQQMNILS